MRSKKALYNLLSNLLLQTITIVCGFIVPKLIISCYGSDVNGLISSITQFLGYITLMEAGVGGVARAVLYKPLAKKDKAQISVILKTTSIFFRKVAYFFIFYLIIVACVYPFIVIGQFDYLFTFSLVFVIGSSILAQYFFGITYQILLQADQRQYVYSLLQSVFLIINASLIVALVSMNCDIILVELVSAIVFILRPIILNYYVRRKYSINTVCNEDKSVLSKKRDGLAQHIAYFLHSNTDIVILTLFTNVKEVSVYYVYNMVVAGVRMIVSIFSSGFEAVFGNMLANNERDNLKSKFNLVNVFVTFLSTIFFVTAAVSIDPFLHLYTSNFYDADYNRPLLGIFLILAEYMYCVRSPFNSLVVSAGHFRETKKSAYIEAFINIILSIIFVNIWGIYGVALATFIAMLYRTIYFIIYAKRNLINRSIWLSIRNGVVAIGITTISILVCYSTQLFALANDYLTWGLCTVGFLVGITILSLLVGLVFYRQEFRLMCKIMMRIMKRKNNEK